MPPYILGPLLVSLPCLVGVLALLGYPIWLWRLGYSIWRRSRQPLDAAGKTCKDCAQPASDGCTTCGGFYCPGHGDRTFWGPLCVSCHKKSRWQRAVGAIWLILLGTGLLWIGFWFPSAPRSRIVRIG
jgi:hypothetical protein